MKLAINYAALINFQMERWMFLSIYARDKLVKDIFLFVLWSITILICNHRITDAAKFIFDSGM